MSIFLPFRTDPYKKPTAGSGRLFVWEHTPLQHCLFLAIQAHPCYDYKGHMTRKTSPLYARRKELLHAFKPMAEHPDCWYLFCFSHCNRMDFFEPFLPIPVTILKAEEKMLWWMVGFHRIHDAIQRLVFYRCCRQGFQQWSFCNDDFLGNALGYFFNYLFLPPNRGKCGW